ncbi:MAG: hypothetical protein KKF30_02245 [Proteobacteria bacterium]|nr:hypothetical protein [Pseudomonadota bacterium]MBU4471567.1 hypothetical protein [Pseudomonadota bacterium]MCG2752573.1 hypothetical protein [Desulfobacteraceae bacterium]
MKPEQIYKELINLAEKLEITVKEENLRKAGIHVNSGLCKIKGRDFFIMDKHKKLKEKIEILSECLSEQKHETIFVVPAIRELLNSPLPASDELHENG